MKKQLGRLMVPLASLLISCKTIPEAYNYQFVPSEEPGQANRMLFESTGDLLRFLDVYRDNYAIYKAKEGNEIHVYAEGVTEGQVRKELATKSEFFDGSHNNGFANAPAGSKVEEVNWYKRKAWRNLQDSVSQ